jgi:hypothetical protein
MAGSTIRITLTPGGSASRIMSTTVGTVLPTVVDAALLYSNNTNTNGIQPFPRFGWHNSGGNTAASGGLSASAAIRYAKGDFIVLGNDYEDSGRQCYTGSNQSFIAAIKALNPNIKVLQYYLPDSMGVTGHLNLPAANTICEANNWALYKNGTSGTRTPNYWRNTWDVWNTSTYVPAEPSTGLKTDARLTKLVCDYFLAGTQGGVHQTTDLMSNLDGLWHDNLQQHTSTGGYSSVNTTYQADWNRDGTPDYQTQVGPPSGAEIDAAFRDGMAESVAWFRANYPGKIICANLAGWGSPDTSGHNAAGNIVAGITPGSLNNIVDGGMSEGWTGLSWSHESWTGSFQHTKDMYQYMMAHTTNATTGVRYASPSLSWDATGRDFSNQTQDWVGARFQLCAALMDNGYPTFSLAQTGYTGNTYNASVAPWLDELGINPNNLVPTGEANFLTLNGKGYLGLPTSAPWTILNNGLGSSKDAYVRYFYNSAYNYTWIVYCNTSFVNTFETFSYNGGVNKPTFGVQRIYGTQDRAFNTGGVWGQNDIARPTILLPRTGLIVKVI